VPAGAESSPPPAQEAIESGDCSVFLDFASLKTAHLGTLKHLQLNDSGI